MFAPCIMGNMGYEFIETLELAVPNIIWEVSAVPDSGGAGKWRGGVSVGQRIQPVDHEMLIIYGATGHTNPPFGLFGGSPGSSDQHLIRDRASSETVEQLGSAGSAHVGPAQEWVAQTSGGGGFGDPMERDPQAVVDDVRDGFVSIEAARQVYKVAVDTGSELFSVDTAETERLRAS
jgi:N-methylhydantoinase B